MLYPAPVVVDTDVLLRNIEYPIRTGRTGALLGQASGAYSLTSGIVLLASDNTRMEAMRHLPELAERRKVSMDVVRGVWNKLIVPHVRFVEVRTESVTDPRVEEVRALHAPDVYAAALVAMLAPAVLATDNRKDFRPFGLPDVKTDRVAVDLFALGEFELGLKGTLLIPGAAGAMTIDGSKKLVTKVGSEAAIAIGLLLLGAAFVFLQGERGRAMRAKAGEIARQAGPPLAEFMAKAVAAGDRVSAFAVDRGDHGDALGLVARRLAVRKPVMTTHEIAEELRMNGLGFDGGRKHHTGTRDWLVREPCFVEWSRGQWTLGYHMAEL